MHNVAFGQRFLTTSAIHSRGDERNLGAPVLAEQVEEALEGGLVPPDRRPDEAP